MFMWRYLTAAERPLFVVCSVTMRILVIGEESHVEWSFYEYTLTERPSDLTVGVSTYMSLLIYTSEGSIPASRRKHFYRVHFE